MNILLVHPHDIYAKIEPWTTRIVNIAKELVRRGHHVKLVYFPIKDEQMEYYNLDPIETVPFDRRRGIFVLLKNTLRLYKLSGWADIIHFQKCFHWASIPVILAGYLKGKPIHYDWDDWEEKIYFYDPPSRKVGRYLSFLERAIPRLVETVSVSSEHLKKLCEGLGVSPRRIFWTPVGADLERFSPQISSKKIREEHGVENELVIYLGQLHAGQYAHLFLQAAALVKKNFPSVHFMIVGGGYKMKELQNLNEKLKSHVIFTGPVPHELIPLYIAASDVAVAPFEMNDITICKSPLKITEYMASGKPVVASDVGEVRRMVGNGGILVKPGDANELAKGITELLREEELRKELGMKARKRAEELFNWVKTTDNLLSAYHLAIFGKHR
ncbi:MAG TPA: glycosyltransferase WbuB [Candidatus Omnitrophica bacterium]|nr:glycosyltransferase WbuB [Candidatus Omnitrophota bacterium]